MACDFNINFISIVPKWEGSVYNSHVFTFVKDSGFYILLSHYYLADAGYAVDNPIIFILY